MKRITLTLLFWALMASAAWPATYWVSKSGKNGQCTNSTSPQTSAAELTIAAGISCLAAGDTLYVRIGTYSEALTAQNIPTGKAGAPTTIRRYASETVTYQPTAAVLHGLNFQAMSYVTFDGINFDCSLNDGDCIKIGFPSDPADSAHHIVLTNLEIKDSCRMGVNVQIDKGFDSGIVISNAIIHNAGARIGVGTCQFGYPGEQMHGVYVAASGLTIDHAQIYNNRTFGVQFYSDYSPSPSNNTIRYSSVHDNAGGIYTGTNGSTNNNVYNNLIYNNSGTWIIHGSQSNSVVYSNTLYNNGGGIEISGDNNFIRNNIVSNSQNLVDSGSGNTFSNNLCSTSCAIGSNNQTETAATTFNNPGTNFTLKAGSAALENGTPLGSSYNLDYASIPRPQGSQWDIGAYERQSAVTITVAITGSDLGCNLASCTVTSNSIILSGTTTATTAGAVTFSTNRASSGGAVWTPSSGTSGYTTNSIALKSGTNYITISSTDASGNLGTASITVTYAPSFPGNSLVAAYGFEEVSGAAIDSSGNSNSGTLFNGATRVQTSFGKAISLNGTNQYISISGTLNNSLSLTQSFTLSAWVQPAATYSDVRVIMHKNADPQGSPFSLYASVAGGYCGLGGIVGLATVNGAAGPQNNVCSSIPLQINVPTHMAVTYDGANLKLYKNGMLISTASASGYMEPSTGSLMIGASEFGEYFQGLIGQVRIYNFAIPLASANNKVFGAICNAEEYIDATASIIGDANCPVVRVLPPLNIKVGAAAAGLKIGAGAAQLKLGQTP